MIPMGTIVAASMILGFIVALPPVAKVCPRAIRYLVGVILLAAGLWNIFWYASQHFTEFWGQAAFGSGAIMVLTSIYILKADRLPKKLQKAKPLVLLMLLGFAGLYAVTIYNL